MSQGNKRILIIGQTPPPFGGQAINIEKIVYTLQKNQVNHRFVRLHFSDQLNDMGRFNGTKAWRLLTTFSRIVFYLITYRPHIVYYPPAGPTRNAIYRDMMLLLPVRLLKRKLVFHFHAGGLSDMYASFSPLLQSLYRYIYHNAAHAICLSERGRKDPEVLKAKQIHIIPSGVEDMRGTDTPAQQDKFIVLFAGLCSESKGIFDFISAIRKCHSSNPAITGRILGKVFGEKEENAIATACREGILTYEGVQTGEAKKDIFTSADVFLFPSFFESESFPTVILEAFSACLPVIATNWRGIPDQVTNGIDGYLVNIHDTDEMCNRIKTLAADTPLYQQLAVNARSNFETKYTMSIFETSILSFFKTNA